MYFFSNFHFFDRTLGPANTSCTLLTLESSSGHNNISHPPSVEDENYWPHRVEQLMRNTADNYQHLGNGDKSDILMRELERINTQ